MNHLKSLVILSAIIIGLLLTASCTNNRVSKAALKITSGTITYSISYPNALLSSSMQFLFPNEMTLFFSEGNQRASFKGSMNLYALDFIHQSNKDSFYTLFKILEKRVYVPSELGSNLFIFDNKPVSIVLDTQTTREIAGFQCSKASIISQTDNTAQFTVWYTNEIGISKPHRNTPFDKIPGIMLEFDMVYEDIHFHLVANSVKEEQHASNLFSIPTDYQESTIIEIEQLIKSIFN